MALAVSPQVAAFLGSGTWERTAWVSRSASWRFIARPVASPRTGSSPSSWTGRVSHASWMMCPGAYREGGTHSGTNNQKLLNDPFYMGMQVRRRQGASWWLAL
jgi:hypothetical protein